MNAPIEQTTNHDKAFDQRMEMVMEAVDKHHMYLLHYLQSLTRHYHDAEDILQTLWKHVLLHFKEHHINCLPILRRKAFQFYVEAYRFRKKRNEQLTEDYAGIEAVASHFEPYSQEEEARLHDQFWSEFPGIKLTAFQRECFWRHARYEHSYSQIAKELNAGKSTVGDAVTTARAKLKHYLENPNKL